MVKMVKTIKNKPMVSLGIFLTVALVMILISYFALHIPLVPICTIVILEALLCACLNRIPVWVHGLFIIAEIVAGICFGKVVFMILMAVVYVAAVTLLYLWTSQD